MSHHAWPDSVIYKPLLYGILLQQPNRDRGWQAAAWFEILVLEAPTYLWNFQVLGRNVVSLDLSVPQMQLEGLTVLIERATWTDRILLGI